MQGFGIRAVGTWSRRFYEPIHEAYISIRLGWIGGVDLKEQKEEVGQAGAEAIKGKAKDPSARGCVARQGKVRKQGDRNRERPPLACCCHGQAGSVSLAVGMSWP